MGKAAQGIFGAEYLRTPIKQLEIKLKPYNISPVEVAIRWIAHHSVLGDGDGIVIGASKVEQIQQTVGMIEVVPYPERYWISPKIVGRRSKILEARSYGAL